MSLKRLRCIKDLRIQQTTRGVEYQHVPNCRGWGVKVQTQLAAQGTGHTWAAWGERQGRIG